MNIQEIITLSELLAEMGQIKRTTKLTSGEFESDSHHSFSLALIAYQVAVTNCPELDANKVLHFALCHDLLEIVTGDDETLHFTSEQHDAKFLKEREAVGEFNALFERYPELRDGMHGYEMLDTPEAAAVFVLDKACTTWTYRSQGVVYAKEKSLHSKPDVDRWAAHTRAKFDKRLQCHPPAAIMEIFEASYQSLRDLVKD